MASLRLDPPRAFNFKYPDEWPRWKRRFEQFKLASGLASESEERQVSTLLYCMGEAAEDTLSSTNISSEDRKKYESVMAKFDTFFNVRKNVIFERARFNCRRQGPNESIEQFITRQMLTASWCEPEYMHQFVRTCLLTDDIRNYAKNGDDSGAETFCTENC